MTKAMTARVPDVAEDATVRPWVMRQFRKHSGSVLTGVFGAAAFDEVALVPVAAAVDRTGRFESNFADRGVRSGFSALLAIWGDPADREAEGERLKTMHREVRGRGKGEFADTRYSALNPDLWNWIAVSGIFITLNSFTPATGIALNPAEREAAYQQLLEAFRSIELPGKAGRLPATHADAVSYYDRMVATELAANPFLDRVVDNLTRLPLPTLLLPPPLRAGLTPLWAAVRPVAGRVIKVCSFGIMHPGVRELTGFDWQSRHDAEFAVYTRVLQLIWRTLPDRLLLIPLAYNRLQYEKLVRLHRSVSLDSFGPPSGCPVG
ncbi:oxygenase MpaB family protein [Mycolicibacterium sp. KC 300]|uniref:Oxygenase MpaB family protein n=2 Tax=Mycolicibacterium arseniciresistens TaxID=3062257 RepID=A0ABT8UBT4_9MYCO|nr:oxygenase MpaB family protein [Mycolicibacterium arseniciresistens]MDO3635240.1 oxygenase MpaB family protein [Mycolicibacterium arseniciresistens]